MSTLVEKQRISFAGLSLPVAEKNHPTRILLASVFTRLITSPERRLNVDQIKHHPFFYGVNWGSIRTIEAPFVPRLRSITDTSYFPTDELEQVPEEPTGGDASAANKDLAFLGYVLSSASENSLCRDRSLGHDVFSFFFSRSL